jgi:hypothetical protein
MKERREAERLEDLRALELAKEEAASRLAARAARAARGIYRGRGGAKLPRVPGAVSRAATSAMNRGLQAPNLEHDISSWEFTEDFIHMVGGLDNMTKIILEDPAFTPSQSEFEEKLNDIFLTRTYTRFNPGGGTYTRFTNAPSVGDSRTGMFPPGALGGTRRQRLRRRRTVKK